MKQNHTINLPSIRYKFVKSSGANWIGELAVIQEPSAVSIFCSSELKKTQLFVCYMNKILE